MRVINEDGLRIIKSFEGCRLTVYPDIKGLATVGYGHRTDMEIGTHINQDMADELLLHDLAIFEAEVTTLVKTPLTDNQFSALVSLVFNCGRAPLTHHLGYYLNAGQYAKAADEFLRWDMCGDHVVPGLHDRRVAERNLFLKS